MSCLYDGYSLKVGDSLTDSIDHGIREARKCVIVLSPSFLENPGWSKAEFKAIMNRHIEEGAVILPVWHNVSLVDVRKHSITLADRIAANSADGIQTVVKKLVLAISGNG